MSKLKDLSNFVDVVAKTLSETQGNQAIIRTDLYASIKEVSEIKYRMVELETRLSNLEAMVKTMHEKGG